MREEVLVTFADNFAAMVTAAKEDVEFYRIVFGAAGMQRTVSAMVSGVPMARRWS